MINPVYDISRSYQDNYDNKFCDSITIPKRLKLKSLKIWDYVINSPVGIPAGPLLNSRYVKFYAALGFDLLVYKTVRTVMWESHPYPNCLVLDGIDQLTPDSVGKIIHPTLYNSKETRDISITNSFGMPSKSIDLWQIDIERANNYLDTDQLLIVSCVGTSLAERNIIDDFVFCATKAVEAGAKAIELNYSCPNIVSKEGSIYQDAEFSSSISRAVKKAIKDIPLVIKLGYISSKKYLLDLLKLNAPYIDGVSSINSVQMKVLNQDGRPSLPGKGRLNSGICGSIIKNLSLEMLKNILFIRESCNFDFVILSCGGVLSSEDFDEYFLHGSDIVMSGTGSMWNPLLALEWQKTQFFN